MITVNTLEELQERALAAVRRRFQGRSTHSESFLGKLADALAGLLWSVHEQVQQADRDATPQEQSTYNALAQWAFVFGLSDGAGGYGAKLATTATGLVGRFTGTATTVVWSGVGDAPQLVAPDGRTLFRMAAAATVGGGGYVDVVIDAITAGVAGNLGAGATVRLINSISSVDATVTIQSGADNGSDKEEKKPLLERLLGVLQLPPKAITAADLKQIAEGIAGVSVARVYPRRRGTGTADVVPLLAASSTGDGSERRPSVGLISSLQDQLDAQRNVGAEGIRAVRVNLASARAILARATPASAFSWDWTGTYGGIVSAYSGTSLTVSMALPASFQTALAAGRKPRLQIQATGVVLPVVVRVVAYNSGTGVCTLEAAPATAPTVGDSIFPGAVFVEPIAAALLAYGKSLGPSRLSGYADPNEYWEDTLRIDQLRRVVLDAADASGNRYIVALPAAPTINGVAADVQPDDTIVSGPEIFTFSSILVTP